MTPLPFLAHRCDFLVVSSFHVGFAAFAAGPRVSTPSRLAPGWDGLATEFNGRHQCAIEARLSSRLSLRGRQRPLRLEQLEIRQMLAGDLLTGMVSSGWFGSYPAAGQPLHASAPSITASDTSTPPARRPPKRSSGQLDWIVQLDFGGGERHRQPGRRSQLAAAGRGAVSDPRRSRRGRRNAGPFLRHHGRPGGRRLAGRPVHCLVRSRFAETDRRGGAQRSRSSRSNGR